ncbi:MAG: DUF3570 domain-containing protein [Opitutae bacterium]|nr:DUF3570 domain-containing protein [Opitutae bacterium]
MTTSCAPSARSRSLGLTLAFVSWLGLYAPRARAENSLTYKYEDYSEANDRMAVTTQSALLEQDLGRDIRLKVQGVTDAIVGATPNGQPAPAGSDQVVLTHMNERRHEWSLDLSRQIARWNLAGSYANSRESDYRSQGWSLNVRGDFNEKNTTLLLGLGGTSDDVKVFFQTPWARKRSLDFAAGVTQLLDANTSVAFNLSFSRASGYLADQYKLVQKSIEVGPGIFLPFTFGENRPDERTKWIALASVNRALPAADAAIEAGYRFYHDTFGTDSHTIEFSWLQKLGAHLVLIPHVRLYTQTAADFYFYRLDATSITPTSGAPRPGGPFYSSDYRLSDLRTTTLALKAVVTLTSRWQFDAEFARYDMRGRDSVTPASAYPRANVVTLGAKFSW